MPAHGSTTDSLSRAINTEHDVVAKLELYLLLSQELIQTNSDSAATVARQALLLAQKIDNTKSIGLLHNQLGNIALANDSLHVAENEFSSAVYFLEQSDQHVSLIKNYISLGNVYIEKENYPEALDGYTRAVKLSEEIGDSVFLPNLYNNMGVAYLNLNNHERALNLYAEALKLFELLNDSSNIAGTTTNIGSIYIRLGDYDIARTYYQSGLTIFEKIGNILGQAHALFKLGLLDEIQGKYQSALTNLTRSLELQSELEMHPSGATDYFLAETYIYIGIVHNALHNYQPAIRFLEDGYYMALRNKQLSLVALASENLSQVYKTKSDFESALKYYEVFKQYSDSSHNEENIRKLARIEMQEEYEDKVREAEVRRNLEEQKRKRLNLVYIFISGGLLLVLIIVILLLQLEKNKKRKIESEHELLLEKLEHANKELTTYVMYLLRKNELILDIIEKLKKARLDAKPENKRIMAELISEMQSSTDTVSWEEFEVRFQQVHTDFYKNLSAGFPDLSNNEIRLCAFFRLNMTNKEIAAITYQTLNSIKVARYRLRKKLNLKKEENLHMFLSKF
jgi:tetratricopeptide (TPR) repeat protein